MAQYGRKHLSNRKRVGYRNKPTRIIKTRRRKKRKRLS